MILRRLFLGGLAVSLAVSLAGCDKLLGTKASFKAIDITGADYGRALSLPDQDGRVRTLADFKGKVVVVFFGYTQCPDVCPTTMAELAQVKKSLGPDGDRVQGVFVSVDPERDTPERLKAYMASFDPSFIALRGTPEQTLAAAKDFKVYYAKVPGKTEGSYTMDHTAGSFVFDPSGRLRLFTRYGSGAEALTSDLKALLAGA
ncbi:MAG: SCO family protein [Rhizobacter sp.]|nr:SCO family protein [Rhizobacter sp.]